VVARALALALLLGACRPPPTHADHVGRTVILYPERALITERWSATLAAGEQEVRLAAPPLVDAGTARLAAPGDPGVVAVSQAAVTVPASADAVLERARGAEITVERPGGALAGRLVGCAADGLRAAPGGGGVVAVARAEARLRVAAGAAEPALVWQVRAPGAGPRTLEASYEAGGVSWTAEYTATVTGDPGRVDLEAWAVVANRSGARLEAGRVLLAQQAHAEAAVLIPIPGPVVLEDGAVTSLPLVAARVPVTRLLVYEPLTADRVWTQQGIEFAPEAGATERSEVDEYAELVNQGGGLGQRLPPGRVRLFRRGADGRGVFVGLRDLGTVAPGQRIRLQLGPTEEISGSRRQVDLAVEEDRLVEEIELSLTSKAAGRRQVMIIDRLVRGGRARVTWSSQPFALEDPHTVRYTVDLPPGGAARVRYRVVYTWR
jgi:hypothetical protein